jgi:hypothetical protein
MLKRPSADTMQYAIRPSILKHPVTFYTTVIRIMINVIVLMIEVLL